MLCRHRLKTTFINEPYQKKTADTITGTNKDFSKPIRANIWRVFTLNNVRTVATNKKTKSRNEVGSKHVYTVFKYFDERI